jgi:hypothetical protein
MCRHIKPGGWIEFQEIHYYPHCDDETMTPSYPFLKYYDPVLEGLTALGINIHAAREDAANLQNYGFTNVRHEVMKIPLGTWPKNKTLKTVGLYMRTSALMGLDAISFGPLCRGLGWSKQEVDVYLVDVRKSIKDPSVHVYFPFHVTYGQKPLAP